MLFKWFDLLVDTVKKTFITLPIQKRSSSFQFLCKPQVTDYAEDIWIDFSYLFRFFLTKNPFHTEY